MLFFASELIRNKNPGPEGPALVIFRGALLCWKPIEYWNLRFICNLVLGIYDFRLKTERQSQLSRTWAVDNVFKVRIKALSPTPYGLSTFNES